MNKTSKNGFLSIIIAVVVVVILAGAGYFVVNKKQNIKDQKADTATTTEISEVTPPSSLPATCKDQGEDPPVITSLSSYSGPVGTRLEIKGCNFSGFEGDKDAYIENAKGIKGFLSGETGSTAKVIKVTLRSPLCQTDTSYSGKPCDAELILTPGIYKIYTMPWGKKSNVVDFTIQEDTGGNQETASWKTYSKTNQWFGYSAEYPVGWSIKEFGTGEIGTGVYFLPPGENSSQKGITLAIINYKKTPPSPVFYTYTTLRKVKTGTGEILVQKRDPGSEEYIASITKGDYTAEFSFARGLDRKYDSVFDHILSSFVWTK